jgi:hypothetical protein
MSIGLLLYPKKKVKKIESGKERLVIVKRQ